MTEQSYWNSNGKYQKEADLLGKLVPDSGESFDTRIELFRCAQNIYYDMFNNGMCNCVGRHGSRNDEYALVESKIDMGYVEKFMKVYSEEQESDDNDNYRSEAMYEKACEAMDLVMDRVIEKITATGFFEEEGHKMEVAQ